MATFRKRTRMTFTGSRSNGATLKLHLALFC
jgi:hypothetical protein